MAGDEADKDQKTEEPSPRRLARALEEGEIALGRDAVAFAALAAGAVTLLSLGLPLRDLMVAQVAETMRTVDTMPMDALPRRMLGPALIGLAACGAAALGATLGAVAQTRGRVWGNLAAPRFDRVFNLKRLTRLVSAEFLVDLGLNFLKVVLVGWVLWDVLEPHFFGLPSLLLRAPGDLVGALFEPLAGGATKVLAVLLLLAGIDFAITHRRFNQKMRMTKEEAKREHKEDEGDPMIKARRRRAHREMAKNRAAVEVPRADALVVNPTHYAVAIRYRRDEGKAPRVTAKGKDKLAEYMRELARAHGVPIVEDVPLARLLYKKVKVGREIPAETYKAVAAVLAFVYRVTGRRPGGVA